MVVSIQGWMIIENGVPKQLLLYHDTKQLRIVPQDYPQQIKGHGDKQQRLDGRVGQIAAPYRPNRKPRLPPSTASPDVARKLFLREFPDVLMTEDDFHSGAPSRMMEGPAM